MSLSATPDTSVLGGSRSSRWMWAMPRYLPLGVSVGGRQTKTCAASAGVSSGSRTRASASATVALAEAADLVPVDRVQVAAAPEPAAAGADGDPCHEPVSGAALVHRDVDDRHLRPVVDTRDLAVEELGDDECLAGAAFEPAQV